MRVAIYGYDTIVGKQALEILENDPDIKLDEFYPLSPFASEYDAVPLGGKNYVISYVDEFDFAKVDVALFFTTKDETERLVNKAQDAGCIVIDDSHFFAGKKDAPVLLREVNPYAIKAVKEKRLACVPLATSSEIVLALSPLHDEYGIKQAVITAMVSASEHGELGIDTLAHETTQMLSGLAADVTDFPAQLAFNLHTRIGELNEQGTSSHEEVILHEASLLLDLQESALSLTCIQVPIFYGHTLSVHVELEEDCSLDEFKDVLRQSPAIKLEEEADAGLVSPLSCAELDSKVYIARIRKFGRASFDFTVVMDNTRCGEAVAALDVCKLLQKSQA